MSKTRAKALEGKGITWPEVPAKISKKKWAEEEGNSKLMEELCLRRSMYRSLQEYRESRWAELVSAFEANPSFFNAYQWLQHHPLFWYFVPMHQNGEVLIHEKYLVDDRGMQDNGIEFYVFRVDPETGSSSEDPALNTELRFCWEACFTAWGSQPKDARVHEYRMDGGASTYEKAVVKAAKKIHAKYGNDRAKFDAWRARHGSKTGQTAGADA